MWVLFAWWKHICAVKSKLTAAAIATGILVATEASWFSSLWAVCGTFITTFELWGISLDLSLELNGRLQFLLIIEETVFGGLWFLHVLLESSSRHRSFHQRDSFHLARAFERFSIIYLDLNTVWGVSSLFEVDSESAWHEGVFHNCGLLFRHTCLTLKG